MRRRRARSSDEHYSEGLRWLRRATEASAVVTAADASARDSADPEDWCGLGVLLDERRKAARAGRSDA